MLQAASPSDKRPNSVIQIWLDNVQIVAEVKDNQDETALQPVLPGDHICDTGKYTFIFLDRLCASALTAARCSLQFRSQLLMADGWGLWPRGYYVPSSTQRSSSTLY